MSRCKSQVSVVPSSRFRQFMFAREFEVGGPGAYVARANGSAALNNRALTMIKRA